MSGYGNINISPTININYLFDVLKESMGKIKDIIRNMNKTVDKTDDFSFQKNITVIKKYMDDLANDFEQIELFDQEFYYFMDIRRMFDYISNDINLYYENITFIKETFKCFKDLIFKKIEVETTKNTEINYNQEHDEFVEFLNKQKDIFYRNIYKKTSQYDELIVKVTNILG